MSNRIRRDRDNLRRTRRRTRLYLAVGGALFLAAAGIFFAGPRVDISLRPKAVSLPDDLDRYLSQSESAFSDIVPGAEKKIVWANADHRRTRVAIVYLHGFSATRQETAPLCDNIARELGANLYYARMTGHGRTGAALAEASVSDWINDTLEAVAIGRRLGERVVIVGTSSGGTLAAWLAANRAGAAAAYVLISPNFAPKDGRSTVLTWPWASKFVPLAFGATRHRSPKSDAERKYWTSEYPTLALLPMMGMVKLANASPLEAIEAPVLVVYCREDPVVNPEATERAFARIGSTQKQLVPLPPQGTASRHVIAGDIMAPDSTAAVSDLIVAFLTKTGVK